MRIKGVLYAGKSWPNFKNKLLIFCRKMVFFLTLIYAAISRKSHVIYRLQIAYVVREVLVAI